MGREVLGFVVVLDGGEREVGKRADAEGGRKGKRGGRSELVECEVDVCGKGFKEREGARERRRSARHWEGG